MISKGKVISKSLQRLGELGAYNNNSSIIYTRASEYFDEIVESVAIDTTFLFNSTTIKLTKTGTITELGENTFNAPIDLLNVIRTVPLKDVRREGAFFHAKCEELILQYCKQLPLDKMPDYMEDYLIYALAVEMCRTHNTYVERLTYMEGKLGQEKAKVLALEGFDTLEETSMTMYEVEVLRKYGRL